MKVRAKLITEEGEDRVVGYYGNRKIREGKIFELKPYKKSDGKTVSAEEQFSKNWMEKVSPIEKKVEPIIEPSDIEEPVNSSASETEVI